MYIFLPAAGHKLVTDSDCNYRTVESGQLSQGALNENRLYLRYVYFLLAFSKNQAGPGLLFCWTDSDNQRTQTALVIFDALTLSLVSFPSASIFKSVTFLLTNYYFCEYFLSSVQV